MRGGIRRKVAKGVALCIAPFLLSACSFGEHPAQQELLTQWADCVLPRLSERDLQIAGESYARTGKMRMSRFKTLGCPGSVRYLLSSTSRPSYEESLLEPASREVAFRTGIYEAVLPAGPASTPQGKAAMGVLGQKLESFSKLRESALRCETAELSAIALLQETEEPFTIAVVGHHSGYHAPDIVRGLSSELIRRVHSMAGFAPIDCSQSSREPFLGYAEEMARFAGGRHPWAPGCRLLGDTEGTTLRCDGK